MFYHFQIKRLEHETQDIYDHCRNKILQCYDRWTKCLDQAVKKYIRTYKIKKKNTAGQRDDYTTGCLLFCLYFNEHYKVIAIDLSKQQAVDADPKAIQQISFTANLCFSLMKMQKN